MQKSNELIQIKEADEKLEQVSKKLSLFAVNPLNEHSERTKFLADATYNPQFRYADHHQNADDIESELASIQVPTSVLGSLLKEKAEGYAKDIKLVQSRGTESFTQHSINLYGAPDDVLLKEAEQLIRLEAEHDVAELSSTEVAAILSKVLKKFGFFEWRVEEQDKVAQAAVDVTARKLVVKKGEQFSYKFLKRLIVHEIATHIARVELGKFQPIKLFSRGLPGYLMTEEGFAVLNEQLYGCLNNSVLKIYAGRVLAINKALSASFRETYNEMNKHFPEDVAWKLTVRAKRGLTDTAQAGAFTKDLVYLKGYLALRDYINNGGAVTNLYYGKIGIQHLDLIDKIPGLKNPTEVPMFKLLRELLDDFDSLLSDSSNETSVFFSA